MSCTPTIPSETHVGDTGTTYRLNLMDTSDCDNIVPFDPTAASVKQIWFKFASGQAIVDADMETVGGEFFLTYQVMDPDFHAVPGKFQVQGHIEFGDGQAYSTNPRSTNDCGQEYRIYPNIITTGSP